MKMEDDMKQLILALLMITTGSLYCQNDTIVDTLYSVLNLEAFINYNTFHHVYMWGLAHPQQYVIVTGDWYDVINGGETVTRNLMSFSVQEAPEGYELVSAKLHLYQTGYSGNEHSGIWPEWNLGNGDFHYNLLIEHVNYGDSVTWEDFHCPVISPYGTEVDSTIVTGWRNVLLTDAYLHDLDEGRIYSQYRFRFPVDTDFDARIDDIGFGSSYAPLEYRPFLILVYNHQSSVEEESLPDSFQSISIFPMPMRNNGEISFQLAQPGFISIIMYNIKGQKVKQLFMGEKVSGKHSLAFQTDAYANGMYLIKLQSGKTIVTKKLLIQK
jgi:hypothetical protein